MIERFGDIWAHAEGYDAVVITTNGAVKKNGEAVLGRGIALEAKNRFAWLPRELGRSLLAKGNHVAVWTSFFSDYALVTFPVKPERGPNGEPGWMVKAKPDLIRRSARELVAVANQYQWEDVLLPRPGCGNGGLRWEDVKPLIDGILDNRFTVMERS